MSSGLFVADEDGDVSMNGAERDEKKVFAGEEEEEDPVVQEIPINLTTGPCPLHMLQFVNKPKKLSKNMEEHPPVAGVRYKEESHVWELDIPLNTQVFYDKEKAKEVWDNVELQSLSGVAVESDMQQYVGVMKEGQLYLVPVEKVAQMRPYFNYIDVQQKARKDDDSKRAAGAGSNNAKSNQVVTMSVKSSSEANQNRLGGALLAHKVAEEEEPKDLEWKEDTYEAFVEEITCKDSVRETLKPKDDEATYLSKLF